MLLICFQTHDPRSHNIDFASEVLSQNQQHQIYLSTCDDDDDDK